jgi:hypothetical protein
MQHGKDDAVAVSMRKPVVFSCITKSDCSLPATIQLTSDKLEFAPDAGQSDRIVSPATGAIAFCLRADDTTSEAAYHKSGQ